MNKTAIKNFAVWARNKLIADISYRAGLMGITERGIASALPQSTGTTEFYDIGTAEPYAISGDAVRQRRRLVELIERKEKETDYETAYKYIIEEVAYTWFNRLIAIRFMEVNDYLPSHIRVLSSESGKLEPDLVTTPFDADLDFIKEEEQLIIELKQNNKLDELFRFLFIKQCNALNNILPFLFEKTKDYTELLLNLSFIDREGVVYKLIYEIPEEDFNVDDKGQIEIIGWLYQYYNIEPKNQAFAKKGKISKEEIPAMTQLFTPEWIVRYMVENSLGRIWVEGHPNTELKDNWKYYVDELNQEDKVTYIIEMLKKEYASLNPEDIKCIDPCMGSGHILVYLFDVLMQIYESQGYARRDAVRCILENNLYGLDIDKRATQLAYFAVMMKARSYDRRILEREIVPHIFTVTESNSVNRSQLKYFGKYLDECDRNKAIKQMNALLDVMMDADEYGSILSIGNYDWDLLYEFIRETEEDVQLTFDTYDLDKTKDYLKLIVEVGKMLSQNYEVVVTNPPYMAVSAAGNKLNKYVKDNYPESKTDLFAVFIERCSGLLAENGLQAMITMHSWMFLSSYEKLRYRILQKNTVNMIHLGARAFEEIGGEVVQTTSFVLRNLQLKGYKGVYYRLTAPNTQKGKEDLFLKQTSRYVVSQEEFHKIPGAPVAYWASPQVMKCFDYDNIEKYVLFRQGMATSDNNRFLRLWYEVEDNKSTYEATGLENAKESKKKWFAYNKGGTYRKWYGNAEYVVNWENDGAEMKAFTATLPQGMNVRLKSREYYFKECYSWSKISSSQIAFRYYPAGFAFDVAGCCVFNCGNHLEYFLALSNSVITSTFASFLSPTLNYELDHLKKIPVIIDEQYGQEISRIVKENIKIAKEDWDSFETSWDFKVHPLVRSCDTIKEAFELWETECNRRFSITKDNEEKINKIFIKIYGLEGELSPVVKDEDITINRADILREVKSLLAYAVGCMVGRYSLDKEGVIYAGGDWNRSLYNKFVPDKDNIITVTDEEYLEDDIVSRFCEWMKVAFSVDCLEENLDFIAQVLGGKGNTSRDVIRNYYMNDFIKDHIRTYQKRPIYWLFDSGKQNGFKALIYLHRYNEDTIGNIRIDYLHRMQRIYENEVERMQDTIDHSENSREIAGATKRKEKLVKQLKECREYDEKIGHLALSRISLDLDDGVKINYEKMQTAFDGKKYQVLTKM